MNQEQYINNAKKSMLFKHLKIATTSRTGAGTHPAGGSRSGRDQNAADGVAPGDGPPVVV